jgi:hypothetical protein
MPQAMLVWHLFKQNCSSNIQNEQIPKSSTL